MEWNGDWMKKKDRYGKNTFHRLSVPWRTRSEEVKGKCMKNSLEKGGEKNEREWDYKLQNTKYPRNTQSPIEVCRKKNKRNGEKEKM